ncbi:MAG: GNAT family N-acetyltransferase [Acidobacteriota bacterium]
MDTGVVPDGHNSDPLVDLRVEYRLAVEADLEETYRIMLRANEDLNRRLGRRVEIEQHSLPSRAMAVRRNGLRYDSDRFWVAEFNGSVAAFGLAIRRRSFWYLAALHVLPEYQSRGVGRELFRRCLGDPASLPRLLLTISESVNLVSTGLYARFGLFPDSAIVHLEGTARSLGRGGVMLRPVDTKAVQSCLDDMDRLVLGEIRPEDHECWSSVPGLVPYLVHEGDRVVGYIYVDRAGALGPAAVERPDLLCPTLSAALEALGTEGAATVRIRIPGTARDSLAALLAAGFGLDTGINLFLTSCPFGRLAQYLFSGADALF